jgi:flavin reductase (DIM6/NTAB) family NADH-FMN oxidoreductase RutF
MIVDFAELSSSRIYFTMIQTVIPRPVAWVLSDNGDGDYNLAPFSYFNAICSDPPLVALSIGKKAGGDVKDTRRNILERSDFTVHIAHRELAASVTASSAELAAGTSELRALGLATEPFGRFRLPRLRDCRIALACERFQVLELGPLPQVLILGLVKAVYIDDAIVELGADGRLTVDPKKLDPISRLGGDLYGMLGEVVSIPRPR